MYSPATSYAEEDLQVFYQCIGTALAEYMNVIIDAKASGAIPSNVHLLSPAFNMTSYTFPGIAQGMKDANAKFGQLDGIAGNVYNVSGQTISHYMGTVKAAFPGANFYITETGTFDHSPLGIASLKTEFANFGPDIKAALLFNATNTNFGWSTHSFSDNVIQDLANQNPGIGVNFATMYERPDSQYSKASQLGLRWTLEISDAGSPGSTIKGIQQAHNYGMTPIVRIGVGGSAHGFEDPQTYVAFLANIASAGGDIYAIAGPNEPDLEPWIAPNCNFNLPDLQYACGGPIDVDNISFRTEIPDPWRFTSKFEADGMPDLTVAENFLTTNFIVEATSYKHIDLEPIAYQLVGSTESGFYDIQTRVNDMRAPAHLNSRIPGYTYPASFTRGPQGYQTDTETETDYTRRLFETSTSTLSGKEKYGERAESEATTFNACLQRLICDPNVEECLKISYDFNGTLADAKCVANVDKPEDCVSLGQTFTMGGKMLFEEPADLLAVSKELDYLGRMYSDTPKSNGSAYNYNDKQTNNLALTKTNSISTLSQLTSPQKIKAANGAGELFNGMSVRVSGGAGGYNLSYRYCIWHESPCGMGDVQSNINGVEINRWKATTTDDPNYACLEPGWGGAPSFNNVSLPFTISVNSYGNRSGPQGICPDNISTSCTVELVNGVATPTCGLLPPPPPVDCRNCESWAPASQCAKIVERELPTVPECADGNCKADELKVDQIPVQAGSGFSIDLGSIPFFGVIFRALGLTNVACTNNSGSGGGSCPAGVDLNASCPSDSSLACDNSKPPNRVQIGVDSNGDPIYRQDYMCNDGCPCIGGGSGGSGGGSGWQCTFNASEYVLYAYPTTIIGDYGNKQHYTRVLESLYKIPGITDKYFERKSAMAPMELKLTNDESSTVAHSNGTADQANSYFSMKTGTGNTRTINVEYFDFTQPLFSSVCLQNAFGSLPDKFPLDLTNTCASFDFIPGGARISPPLTPIDPTQPPTFPSGDVASAIGAAALKNNIPESVLLAILETEAGTGFVYDRNSCIRNSYTATGPMQITDGTVIGYTTDQERSDWGIRTDWNSTDDHTPDGRCDINNAMEIAARILQGKADQAVSLGIINNNDLNNVNTAMYAAGGYYGTRNCQPTPATQAWGVNISYCDFFMYRLGQCAILAPSCDGIGPGINGAKAPETQAKINQSQYMTPINWNNPSIPVKGQGQQNQNVQLLETKTNSKPSVSLNRTELISRIEEILNRYKDQITTENPTINDLPPAMIEELKALAKEYE